MTSASRSWLGAEDGTPAGTTRMCDPMVPPDNHGDANHAGRRGVNSDEVACSDSSTSPSHGENRGSSPLGDASRIKGLGCSFGSQAPACPRSEPIYVARHR